MLKWVENSVLIYRTLAKAFSRLLSCLSTPRGRGDRFHSSHYEDEALDAQKLKVFAQGHFCMFPIAAVTSLNGFKQHTFYSAGIKKSEKSKASEKAEVHVLSSGGFKESLFLCLFQLLRPTLGLWPLHHPQRQQRILQSHHLSLLLTPASLF